MENENYENLVVMNDYFQLDFAEQTIKGNRKFEEFKKQRLNKLGKDAKLFHCTNDNIYFYISKKECEIDDNNNHCYCKQCSLCKNYICYFCERIGQGKPYKGNCCILSRLYYLFFVNGPREGKKDFSRIYLEETNHFIVFIILNLIPFTKYFVNSFSIFLSLFGGLHLKDKKWKNYTYVDYICGEEEPFIVFSHIILLSTALALSICYTVISLYLNIIILIISVFSKFYPIKYLFGVYSTPF